MENDEKLLRLYSECITELKEIGIDILDESIYGKIDIQISPRNCKRYGCCKQEKPDLKTKVTKKYKNRRIVYYEKYCIHHVQISKWVMELNDNLIKNTIIHELIHCIPKCNNHGEYFRKYSRCINEKLGYNISRLGDKNKDLKLSNIEYNEKNEYKYKVECKKCGQTFFRKRLNTSFLKKYRCGICKGKFELTLLN